MEKNQKNNVSNKQEQLKKIIHNNENHYDNFNLNEIAINAKVNYEVKPLKQESKRTFDSFYYAMWMSNKD